MLRPPYASAGPAYDGGGHAVAQAVPENVGDLSERADAVEALGRGPGSQPLVDGLAGHAHRLCDVAAGQRQRRHRPPQRLVDAPFELDVGQRHDDMVDHSPVQGRAATTRRACQPADEDPEPVYNAVSTPVPSTVGAVHNSSAALWRNRKYPVAARSAMSGSFAGSAVNRWAALSTATQ